MKPEVIYRVLPTKDVTLRVRVWIETRYYSSSWQRWTVTLRVRVWIETVYKYIDKMEPVVTLRVRVWIETGTAEQRRIRDESPSA